MEESVCQFKKPYSIGYIYVLSSGNDAKTDDVSSAGVGVTFGYCNDMTRFVHTLAKNSPTPHDHCVGLYQVYRPRNILKKLDELFSVYSTEGFPESQQEKYYGTHYFPGTSLLHVIGTIRTLVCSFTQKKYTHDVWKPREVVLPQYVNVTTEGRLLMAEKPIGFIYAIAVKKSIWDHFRASNYKKHRPAPFVHQSYENTGDDETIFKVGYSLNVRKRVGLYPDGAKVLLLIQTHNPRSKERQMLDHLCSHPYEFPQQDHSREVFGGDAERLVGAIRDLFLTGPESGYKSEFTSREWYCTVRLPRSKRAKYLNEPQENPRTVKSQEQKKRSRQQKSEYEKLLTMMKGKQVPEYDDVKHCEEHNFCKTIRCISDDYGDMEIYQMHLYSQIKLELKGYFPGCPMDVMQELWIEATRDWSKYKERLENASKLAAAVSNLVTSGNTTKGALGVPQATNIMQVADDVQEKAIASLVIAGHLGLPHFYAPAEISRKTWMTALPKLEAILMKPIFQKYVGRGKLGKSDNPSITISIVLNNFLKMHGFMTIVVNPKIKGQQQKERQESVLTNVKPVLVKLQDEMRQEAYTSFFKRYSLM